MKKYMLKITKFDWEYFKNYVETYDPKKYADNNAKIVFDDMLYGLGVAVKPAKYRWDNGYKLFKSHLASWLHDCAKRVEK